jgi:hypothetical protein
VITITAVNDAPVAVDDAEATDDNTTLTGILLLDDDTDVDGDSLSLTAITSPSNGTITMVGNTVTYAPNANASIDYSETLTYTVSDGTVTDTGTLTITVTAANDAPVAVDDTETILEDAALTNITVLDDDTDADGDSLTLSSVSLDDSSLGTVAINADNTTIDFTPAADANGTATVTYTVSDGTTTDTGDLVITITAVNDAPVAVDDAETIAEDASATTFTVIDDDTDTESDSLSLSSITYTGTGTVSLSGNQIVYTPASNFNGTETVTYTVSDGTATDTGTLTITVTAANDAPVAVDDTETILEDAALTNITVLDDDTDADGDSLTLSSVSLDDSSLGTVAINADNTTIDFTPAADANGTATVTYTVSDGTTTDTGDLVITITAVNDAPVAVDDAEATDDNTTLTGILLLDDDTDVDGDSLSLTAITSPSNGTITMVGNTVTYAPNANASIDYSETLTYTVSDGTVTDTGTLTITVTAANDAPVAVDDTETILEDAGLTNITVLDDDTDADGDSLTLSSVSLDDSSLGTVAINADNTTIDFTPAADANGTATVTYTVSDGTTTDTGDLVITITAVNDAPVAVDDAETIAEDASATTFTVIDDDTDTESDSLSLSSITYTGTGTVSLSGNQIVYTPASNFNGTETVTYTVSDGTVTDTGTLTITVTAANDAPVAVDDTETILEDAALTNITVLDDDTDADGDSLTLSSVSLDDSSLGTVAINADNTTIDFTPAADANGTATVTYTVSDGTTTDTGNLVITITAVNDAPVAVDDAEATDDNTTLTGILLLDDDTDVDGDSLSLTAITSPSNGTITMVGNTVTYAPNANASIDYSETLTYTVSDGTVTDTGTLTITVTAANDAPVAVDDTETILEDAALTNITVLDDDTDADGDSLTLSSVSLDDSSLGTVAINADNTTIDFTPAADANGTATVTYTVSDGTTTDTGDLVITITAVDDAPTISSALVSSTLNTTIAEDSDAITINVLDDLSYTTDADGDAVSITAVQTNAGAGSVSTDGSSITYTPASDYSSDATITFTAGDSNNTFTASFTVSFSASNDAPVAVDDTETILEDAALTNITVLDDDTDADGDSLTLSSVSLDDSSLGTVAINADNTTIDFTPAADANGTATVTYTVSDGTTTDTGTLTITITAVDDGPSGGR